MTNRQKIKSFYMSKQDFDLESSVDNSIFGRSIIEYEIYRNIDVTNLHNVKGYIVTVKQRVIIPNITPYVAGASSIRSYKNYPAILKNGIKIDVNNNAKVELIGIFPRTLNSNVTTSSSSHTGKESSVIRQNSTGSSYTNVNTFGVGSNIGFFGPVPVGGIQLSYSHSWESTDSHQASESR